LLVVVVAVAVVVVVVYFNISGWMGCAGHTACMGYFIQHFCQNFEWKRPVGRLGIDEGIIL
jgi:hypothetical protein